jgi:hypothetical protein
MRRELYADNYPHRRLEALIRSGGRCEHVIEGKRCPSRLGVFKISHAGNACFEQLFIHHPDHDPWNPEAELLVICSSCHMRLHRQPEQDGKILPQKRGYRVIGIDHLLHRLARVGFTVAPNEECRFDWSIGPFAAEAADPIDALVMALHWLTAEVADLQRELARQSAECHRPTDMQTRMLQAGEHHLPDAALRDMRRSPTRGV